jgi:hypothetical protein
MRLPGSISASSPGSHGGSIRIVHKLQPLGVAMAGADVFDPYND